MPQRFNILFALGLLLPGFGYAHQDTHCARCTGSAYCSACSNCSRCAHCSAGGSCGVCAGTSAGRSFSGGGGNSGKSAGSRSSTSAIPRPTVHSRPKLIPVPTPQPLPQQFTGIVVAVTEGDTLAVETASNRVITIRLYGIDAPSKDQSFGQISRKTLVDFAYGKTVEVQRQSIDKKRGWLVAVVTPHEARSSANARQIREGMARWDREHSPTNKIFEALEKEARDARRGIWSK
jgi:endonuclease YncB( thermonuclease family)